MTRALELLGSLAFVAVVVRAVGAAVLAGDVLPFVVVGSFATYAFAATIVLAGARTRRGPTTAVAGGLARWIPPIFAWVPYAVVATHLGPELHLPVLVVYFGITLVLAGVAFALWALLTIGRHFDLDLALHRDHEVVRTGPYRIVRHPIYTGLALHSVGAILVTGNVLLLLGTLLGTYPVLYARARAEERLLREQLGSEYDAYAREVGMLVPLLGRAS